MAPRKNSKDLTAVRPPPSGPSAPKAKSGRNVPPGPVLPKAVAIPKPRKTPKVPVPPKVPVTPKPKPRAGSAQVKPVKRIYATKRELEKGRKLFVAHYKSHVVAGFQSEKDADTLANRAWDNLPMTKKLQWVADACD